MQDKQQIYGRNDMVMLYKHNKIYGSLGLTEQFVFDTINGENTVVLNNPKVGKFKDVVTDLNILGNSHQDSTTGKQLFKLTDNYLHAYFYHGENKEIVPYSSNAVVYLPCEPNTTYTIHGRKNINNDMTRKNRVGLTSELPAFNVKITKTAETTLDKPLTITTEEDTKYLVIMAITDGEIGKLNFDKVLENNTSKLMVEVGDKASPYEPYTGGKPSPSPDYLQEIKNVGKWNEVTQKYEVDVKVTGKNIVNIPDFGVNTPETAIKCYISKNICISAQEKADVSKSVWRFKALHKDGSLEYITDATLPGCFYATKENPIVTITYRGIYMTREYKGIMVEYGTVATKYEPYKEQTLTLTSDRPITKWDKLVEQDGQIGWLYGSKKSVLNEKTSWKVFRIDPNEEDNFTFSTNIIGSLGGNQTSFCKTFKNVNYAYAKEHRGKYGLYSDHVEQRVPTRYFRQPNESVQTIEQWKEWLINNPIELWHKSETEFIPLPQEEQDAIRALTTYYPTTVIMVDGGELPVGIQATYKQVNK